MDAISPKAVIVPFSLKDAPCLIERLWPAQKISVETKREFDAHGAQTLTALGSYWKGRKRLIYVRACVLAALLPATDDSEKDLQVFEQLMAIDDRAFLHREVKAKPTEIARLAIEAGALSAKDLPIYFRVRGKDIPPPADFELALAEGNLLWATDSENIEKLRLAAYSQWSYQDKVARSLRPEELAEDAYASIWHDVNRHLKTSAFSHSELTEQLGIMRFGHRPKVADTFCGAGSIPFEAARLGCDVYASDLNPIACMLSWGALHLVGGGDRLSSRLEAAQNAVASAVERKLIALGAEHDSEGNRAKSYLYCIETRCPQTGWVVPLLIVATDAACEGLNLQTLGTLINVDLPWNPSRLEQRIGRIKRFGQRRDRVDMLNLLYHGSAQPTVDEKVYAKLSSRMKDRFDIFGTLPDVIDDDWIDDEERFDEELKNYTERRARANAFDLRYAGDVIPKDERWELCEKVLARNDVKKRLSRGWGEREWADA